MLGFLRPADRCTLNQLVHLVLVRVVKGRDSNDHLVDEDTQCPPVECLVVSRADNHFGCEILGCSAERIRLFRVFLHNLGQAKVGQHDVPVVIYQNVLRLEVSVDNVGLVEVTDCEGDLCGVELCLFLRKTLLLRQVLEELASLHKLHDEVDAIGLLEDVVHSNDEGVIDLVEDHLLDLQRLNRLVLDDHVLPHSLHRVVLATNVVADQVYFSESALSDHTHQLEVVPATLSNRLSAKEHSSLIISHRVQLVERQFGIKRLRCTSLGQSLLQIVHRAAMAIVSLCRDFSQICHEAIRVFFFLPWRCRRRRSQLSSSFLRRRVELDVFLVDSCQNERHSGDSASNILL